MYENRVFRQVGHNNKSKVACHRTGTFVLFDHAPAIVTRVDEQTVAIRLVDGMVLDGDTLVIRIPYEDEIRIIVGE